MIYNIHKMVTGTYREASTRNAKDPEFSTKCAHIFIIIL